MNFRTAREEDASNIAALVNSCYRGESSKVGWTTEAELLDGTRTDEAEIENLITRPASVILVCSEQNALVGSVHIQQQGSSCYLGMLVVNPGLQSRGVGRELIQAAENHARELWGSKKMTMSVISVRSELIAYYERRGYGRTGHMQPFAFDEVHGIPRVE